MIGFNRCNKRLFRNSFNLTDIKDIIEHIRKGMKYVRLKEKDELIEKIGGIENKLIELSWRLACANVKLAEKLAKKYRNRTKSPAVGLKDLIHEGLIALFYAALGFNPKINPDFENYAKKRLKQTFRLATAGSSTIKLPTNLVGKMGKFFKTEHYLLQTLCRLPSPEEIAKKATLPLEDVKIIVMWLQGIVYLYAPIRYKRNSSNGDGNKALIEFIAAPPLKIKIDNTEEIDELQIAIRIQIKEALKRLAPIESKILKLQFWRGIPPQKIARKMNLRRSYVKNTTKAALEKLRQNTVLQKLK